MPVFPPFHWWRTVFWLIPAISVYTVVFGALSLISAIGDHNGRFAHRCARCWAWLILATTGVRVTATGRERLDPRATHVFVSNHQSIYDIPIVFASLPFQLRIISKASLGRVPFLGWHLRWTGHLLVDRARPGPATLKRVAELMQRGHSLIVFPEGTRSVDGRVGRLKRGVFLLAIEAGLPIVPVAVLRSRHVMLKGRLMTCPGDVGLVVHPPIATSGRSRDEAGTLAETVRNIIESTVRERDLADAVARRALDASSPAGRQSRGSKVR
jgi:1-acyl-sn-glycerol-3-phosphate acyltransferase